MRYGIFSDVHSNLEALETVLSAYSPEGIDAFFCGGDIVGYGADPDKCVELVRDLPAVSVAGNHDWAVAGKRSAVTFNPDAREAVRWTRSSLGKAGIKNLESLRLVYQAGLFTLVHGTLNDPADFVYLTDTETALETFALMETAVCFVGHTHVAGIFTQDRLGRVSYLPSGQVRLEKDSRYIVNVGSVGQPRDRDARSAYCVYDTDSGWIEIKRVAYDIKSAADKIIRAGLPEFLARRLWYGI